MQLSRKLEIGFMKKIMESILQYIAVKVLNKNIRE